MCIIIVVFWDSHTDNGKDMTTCSFQNCYQFIPGKLLQIYYIYKKGLKCND